MLLKVPYDTFYRGVVYEDGDYFARTQRPNPDSGRDRIILCCQQGPLGVQS